MIDKEVDPQGDIWSRWLLHDRHAGNQQLEQKVRRGVARYIERLLDGARLEAGMRLADIGTGEGAVAFRAIERVGGSLRVLLTDISLPLLRHAEEESLRLGVRDQCTFLACSADQLSGIDDASVDVVTTRSVLAYIADKAAALSAFHRVLVPGGRISIAEPILQDEAHAAWAMRTLLEMRARESMDPAMPLLHRWKAAQYPDTQEKIRETPITNYNERDLVRLAQAAGFVDIHMELHIDVVASQNTNWDVFLHSSPHPLAAPLSDILAEQFTPEERLQFERAVRPMVEDPKTLTTDRMAYLSAIKPGAT